MTEPIHFAGETLSNEIRELIARQEPIAQRTYTPTQLVISKSEGIYHYTPEGRRLADFSSGVLVSNLGHNSKAWYHRLAHYMGWNGDTMAGGSGYCVLPPLTAYNAITPVETDANHRLLQSLRSTPMGERLEQILWSASGSEGIQKALWAALHFQPSKDIIVATRRGFHGKKGLAGAVTGDERSPERDPRVHFISFPVRECQDIRTRVEDLELEHYVRELEDLRRRFPGRLNCLITEPYLGGGGSFHPPKAYLKLLVDFCRANHMTFILDEVQSNFGRTGDMYAFETYGVQPDMVVLGKGIGNGIPVNCVAGRADILRSLGYGDASDTWSAHPLGCAAVLATLDIFETNDVIAHTREVSARFRDGLERLHDFRVIAAVRGEGMVWGIEFADVGDFDSQQLASQVVRQAYLGDEAGNAIHLLGPLSGNVLRISPPLTISLAEAGYWLDVLYRIVEIVDRATNAAPPRPHHKASH